MLLAAFVIFFLAGAANFAAFILSLPRHRSPGGRWLVLALLVSTIWMWSNAILHTLFPLEVRIYAAQLSLLASLSGVLYFFFAVEYSAPGTRVRGWKALPLLVMSFGLVVAVLVPSWREHVWTNLYLDPKGSGIIIFEWGMAYYAVVAAGLAVSIVSITQLMQTAIRAHGVHRTQAVTVTVGMVIPSVFYLAAWILPGQAVGMYPAMSVGLSGIAYVFALTSVGLLRSVPVGRREFVDSLVDGFLVTGVDGVVVDANPASARILTGNPTFTLIGLRYEQALTGWLCNGAPCSPIIGEGSILTPVDPERLAAESQRNGVRPSNRVVLRSWEIKDVSGAVIGQALALRDDTLDEMARRRLATATNSIAGWADEMGAVEELLRKVR